MAQTDAEKLAEVRKVLEGFDDGEELLHHDTLADAVACLIEEVEHLRHRSLEVRKHAEKG